MVKPTLIIRASDSMEHVLVFRQYGDQYDEQAYTMPRDALFQALAHPRIRDEYADIIYDNRL